MSRTTDARFEASRVMAALADLWPRGVPRADHRARILDSMAAALESAREEILRATAAETALLAAELAPEFDRMTGTLRLFAAVIRDGSWVRAAVDPPAAAPGAAIGPNHDVRSMLIPLGPVAVFGASNFPLAYGVCGGDTASAVAAGCPVVVKEHPAHPQTGRLIWSIAQRGIAAAGGDPALLGLVANTDPRDLAPARDLVTNPLIKAVGFTGSTRAGLALEDLARSRPDRIPVFAEMGSANPVLITPSAAASRGREIGQMLADSMLLRFGQQCTCPGIIVVPDARGAGAGRELVGALAERLGSAPARDMLAPWIRDSYVRRVARCLEEPGVDLAAGSAEPIGARGARAALLRTTPDRFAERPDLREEIFGPGAIIVDASASPGAAASLPLPASLTLTIHHQPDAADVALARSLADAHAAMAGRIIFNGVPTGVRVAAGMVHGGPFPASNRPDTTAVGPRAIERWCRPVCWQNAGGLVPPPPAAEGAWADPGASGPPLR